MSFSEPRDRDDESVDADIEKLENDYLQEIILEHELLDHLDGSMLGDGTIANFNDQTLAILDNRVKRIPRLHDSDPYYQTPKDARLLSHKDHRRSTKNASTDRHPSAAEKVKDTTTHSGRISRILASSSVSKLISTKTEREGKGKADRAPSGSASESNGRGTGVSRFLSSASISRLLNTAPLTPVQGGESTSFSGLRTNSVENVHPGRVSKFLTSFSAMLIKLVDPARSTLERARKSDRTTSGSGSGSGSVASFDAEMIPESPPGFRGVIEIPSSEIDEEESPPMFTLKQKYSIAACLGVFLIAGIAVCATALSSIQQRRGDTDVSSETFDDWEWTFKPTQQVSSQPTLSFPPTMNPTTQSPTFWPTAPAPTTAMPTQYPTRQPSVSPTDEPTVTPIPTQSPTMAPTYTKEGNFTQILTRISPSTLEEIQDSGSSQSEAFEWIIRDPNYYSYSEYRIVQRWALALFSLEFSTSRRANRGLNEAFGEWMEYTDECKWSIASLDNEVGCDNKGVFRNLIIRDLPLRGSIPSELCLLTALSKLILGSSISKLVKLSR